jgi:hypothetical protein
VELQSLYHLTNGATKSLAPNKWCYHFAAPINKIVKRENLFLIFVAPLIWCYRLCSTIQIGGDVIKSKLKGAAYDLQHLLIFA